MEFRRLAVRIGVVLGLTLAVGVLLAGVREYRFVFCENGLSSCQPITYEQASPTTSYRHCYYGEDEDGHPMGVATIEMGEDCAEGTSCSCTGTIAHCDCYCEFRPISECFQNP